jgi:hypothetical protein
VFVSGGATGIGAGFGECSAAQGAEAGFVDRGAAADDSRMCNAHSFTVDAGRA